MAKPPRHANPSPAPQSLVNQSLSWNGPLPPPAALRQFDEIIPGGADRILKMAEAEQQHRISSETMALPAAIADTKRGQILGFIVAAGAVGGAVVSIFMGSPWPVPVAFVSVPVLGMVQALVQANHAKQQE